MNRRNFLGSAVAATGGYVLGLVGAARDQMERIVVGPAGLPGGVRGQAEPPSAYVKYVSPRKSIQAAYDSLPANSGGLIYLLPGRHDVEAGLKLDRRKPVSLVGLARWRRYLSTTDVGDATRLPGAVLYSSSTPSWLIDTTTPMGAVVNGNGFEFRNLTLDFRTSSIGILADNVNHGVIENCFFAGPGGDSWAIMLVTKDSFVEPGTQHGNDASWWRVRDNNSTGCGFFGALGAFEGTTPPYQWNHNQHVIQGNVCFRGGADTATNPAIWIRGGHRSLLSGNNIEGNWDPAILLEGCWSCRSDGNAGEDPSDTPGITFIKLENSAACFISDLGTSTSSGQMLIVLDSRSTDNVVIAPTLTAQRSLYGTDGHVDDGSNNVIITGAVN